MKKTLSAIFSILFAFSLLTSLFLLVIKKNVNEKTIMDLLSNDNLSYQYNDTYLGNSSSVSLMSNTYTSIDSNEINKVVKFDNLDDDLIKEILDDKEINDFVEKYYNEIINYMTGKTEQFKFDRDKVDDIIDKVITKYEEKTGEVVDRDDINKEISSAITDIEDAVVKVKESGPAIKFVAKLFGNTMLYISIGLTFLFALCIFISNRSITVTLKYLSIPAIIVGVILLILGLIISIIDINEIQNVLNSLSSDFKLYGIISFAIGIICCLAVNIFFKNKLEMEK